MKERPDVKYNWRGLFWKICQLNEIWIWGMPFEVKKRKFETIFSRNITISKLKIYWEVVIKLKASLFIEIIAIGEATTFIWLEREKKKLTDCGH